MLNMLIYRKFEFVKSLRLRLLRRVARNDKNLSERNTGRINPTTIAIITNSVGQASRLSTLHQWTIL